MAFTAGEITSIANGVLDHFEHSQPRSQSIQNKPLMEVLVKNQKTFAAGKTNISLPVKNAYTTAISGYTHTDTVTYANPANLLQAFYPWKELHAGITVTMTELKKAGISVVDTNGESVTRHEGREIDVIVDLLKDKLEDMDEGTKRSFNNMLWLDGTQDANQVPGIDLLLAEDPTTGTVGGIDQSANSFWRNRSLTGTSKITASPTGQTLTKRLRAEFRQLTRYSKSTRYLWVAGTDFIGALESEIHEKGQYTLEGFKMDANTDMTMNPISMRGVGTCRYDPTLDDNAKSKFSYLIDLDAIQLRPMAGEEWKQHVPARVYNQYAIYKSQTWTGGLVADMLRSSGVYEVA